MVEFIERLPNEKYIIAYGLISIYEGMQIIGQGLIPYGMGRDKYIYGIKRVEICNYQWWSKHDFLNGIDRDY